MTDNQLPNAGINEALALRAGWLYDNGTEDWQKPGDGDAWYTHPPDFCGDWNYTGPLLEALPDGVRVEITKSNISGKTQFKCAFNQGSTILGKGFGPTRKEAIARAAHAMGEGKE